MAYTIENVDWARDKHRLKAIREDVFVLEWRVPQDSEFDERDASAFHVLLLEDGEEIPYILKIESNGDLTEIARIKDNKREEAPKQHQRTWKKLKE